MLPLALYQTINHFYKRIGTFQTQNRKIVLRRNLPGTLVLFHAPLGAFGHKGLPSAVFTGPFKPETYRHLIGEFRRIQFPAEAQPLVWG